MNVVQDFPGYTIAIVARICVGNAVMTRCTSNISQSYRLLNKTQGWPYVDAISPAVVG
jgi:hypothetical protein